MAEAQLPEIPDIPKGLTADYVNVAVGNAMLALQSTPDYEHLAAFLLALREDGYLVVDVTGTPKKKSTRIRTIRSTKGQLLLPIFTSMAELRRAVPKSRAAEAKGAMLPAAEALALIGSDRFIAAQFDAGSAALVVLRKYLDLVLSEEPIDAAAVEALR